MRGRGLSWKRATFCALALVSATAPGLPRAQTTADAPKTADAAVSSGPRSPPPSSDVQPFRSSAAPLTLGDCIRRALSRGFDMELQGHDVAIARDDLPIAQSFFDPVISAGTARSTDQTGHSAATPDLYSTGVGSQIGITQKLRTGTSVTLGSRLDRFASNQPRTVINGSTLETTENSLSYTSGLTLSITQPLLKGFGGVNRIPIRQAEISADIAERSYEDRALDVVQRTEAAYYLLTGSRDQLSVFRTSQQLAERLLKEADARHTAGMATKLDILEAQVGIANAKLNVLQAENAVRTSEDQLLAMIGRFEFDTPIGATSVDDVSSDVSPTVEASYALAMEHQPALRNARLGLELSRLQLELAQDDLKLSFNLDLSLGLNGDDRRSNRAFSNAFEPERSAWQAGFSVTYPLGRAGEKARFRQSTRAVSRDELLVHQLEQDVLVSIRSAVRTVQMSQESVRLAELASNLAQEQYEAERIRYRSGLSTSRRVLEVQKDLETARVAQLQAKLNLRTSLSALYRIEGSSLDHYGITLKSDFH